MMFYTNIIINKNQINWVGYRADGKKITQSTTDFQPTIYTVQEPGSSLESATGFDGRLLGKYTMSLDAYFEFVRLYKKEMPLYGEISPIYQFIASVWGKGKDFYHLEMIRNIAIDIEVLTETKYPNVNDPDNEISSISLKDFKTGKIYILSTGDFVIDKCNLPGIDNATIQFKKMNSEIELLQGIVYIFEKLQPDVITGWNVEFFDIPYLTNRIVKLFGMNMLKKMSPLKFIKPINKKNNNEDINSWDLAIPVLDYMALYKKYMEEKQERYSLDHIADVEIGLQKLPYKGNLTDLFKTDPQKYIEYNIWDSELVYLLDKKLKLIELAQTVAYESRALYQDVYSPVKIWDILVYNALLKKGTQIPPNRKNTKDELPGGFVREPKLGIIKWVTIFDVNSLYPNIVIGANLATDTLIKEEKHNIEDILYAKDGNDFKERDVCWTPNNCVWSRSKQSIFGELMEKFYNDRKEIKKKQKKVEDVNKKHSLHLKQYAYKILLNSGYGAFANEYFRYYNIKIASAITLTGQALSRYAADYLTEKLSGDIEVIAGDTDSIMISCDKWVQKQPKNDMKETAIMVRDYADTVIHKHIKEAINRFSDKLNFYKNTLDMKREHVGDSGLFAAKKHYVLRYLIDDDDNILDKPKFKIKGIEIVKKSTPKIVRAKLKDMLDILINADFVKLGEEIKKFYQIFLKATPENIAFPRSVSDLEKCSTYDVNIYTKSTPIQVRGALLYNWMLNKLNLNKKYRKIISGDKIKFLYLKTPNPLRSENIVSFLDELPEEFGINNYIDYETQFEKTTIGPLRSLLEPCGVNINEILAGNKKTKLDLW